MWPCVAPGCYVVRFYNLPVSVGRYLGGSRSYLLVVKLTNRVPRAKLLAWFLCLLSVTAQKVGRRGEKEIEKEILQ